MIRTPAEAMLPRLQLAALVAGVALCATALAAETVTITGELRQTVTIEGGTVVVQQGDANGVQSGLAPFESDRFQIRYPSAATEPAGMLELKWRISGPSKPIGPGTWIRYLKGPKEIVDPWTSFTADATVAPPPTPGRRMSGRIFFEGALPTTACYEAVVWVDEAGDDVADVPDSGDKRRCPVAAADEEAAASGGLTPFSERFEVYYPPGAGQHGAQLFMDWEIKPAGLPINRTRTKASRHMHPALGGPSETNFDADPGNRPESGSVAKRRVRGSIHFHGRESDPPCIRSMRWVDTGGTCHEHVPTASDKAVCPGTMAPSCPP